MRGKKRVGSFQFCRIFARRSAREGEPSFAREKYFDGAGGGGGRDLRRSEISSIRRKSSSLLCHVNLASSRGAFRRSARNSACEGNRRRGRHRHKSHGVTRATLTVANTRGSVDHTALVSGSLCLSLSLSFFRFLPSFVFVGRGVPSASRVTADARAPD